MKVKIEQFAGSSRYEISLWRGSLWGGLVVLWSLCATAAVSAAEFCVGTAPEFQAALTTAQENGEDDAILLVKGIYPGSFGYVGSGAGESISIKGGYDFGCESQSGMRADTILYGEGPDVFQAVLTVGGAGTVEIQALTIKNGWRGLSVGGVQNFSLNECSIEDNGSAASSATGIALSVDESAVITDCVISRNIGKDDAAGQMRAMPGGSILLERVVVSDNESTNGADSLDLIADPSGGAIRIGHSRFVGNRGRVRLMARNYIDISNNLFLRNTASSAPAVSLELFGVGDPQIAQITNNAFIGNQSESSSQLYPASGAIEITNVVSSESHILVNNIFWQNRSDGVKDVWILDGISCFPPNSIRVANNLLSLAETNFVSNCPPTEVSGNLANVAPQFLSEADDDYRLAPVSLLIDAGSSQSIEIEARDLIGNPRVIGGGIDIGPLESLSKPASIARVVGSPGVFAAMRWSPDDATFLAATLSAHGDQVQWVSFIPDSARAVTGIGERLLVLGQTSEGAPRVQIRDGASGEFIRNQSFFNQDWLSTMITVLPDITEDGNEGFAVLAKDKFSGENGVQIRDGVSGEFIGNVFFLNPNWLALDLLQLGEIDLNDGPELGVLATNETGRIVVMVKDAKTNTFIRNVFFLNSNWRAIKALVLEDFSGNAAREIALLAQNKESGQLVIMTKDAATSTFLNNTFPFGSAWEPIKAVVLPDENSNGSEEIAVLASQKDTGVLVIQVRDPMSGQHLRNLTVLGNNWIPKDIIFLPDIGGGVPGLSVLANRKSDDLAVVQIIEAVSGDLVSNVFLN